MLVLAFDSSAVAASAALVNNGVIIAESYINCGLTHSQTLLPLAENTLRCSCTDMESIDSLAVSVGPGSFTGIRIGVACVKGMAFPLKKNVYGISTLEAMAWQCADEDNLICPVMDARRDQFYTALFSFEGGKPVRMLEDSALPKEALENVLKKAEKPVVFIGDGADKAYSLLGDTCNVKKTSEINKYQRASGVAFAAESKYNNGDMGIDGALLRPSYLRPSQAERERKKRTEEIL